MAAIVMERSTDKGTAILMGMSKASKGTAIKDSPKPNAERITEAMNIINKM